jgi:hypothetical protein
LAWSNGRRETNLSFVFRGAREEMFFVALKTEEVHR